MKQKQYITQQVSFSLHSHTQTFITCQHAFIHNACSTDKNSITRRKESIGRDDNDITRNKFIWTNLEGVYQICKKRKVIIKQTPTQMTAHLLAHCTTIVMSHTDTDPESWYNKTTIVTYLDHGDLVHHLSGQEVMQKWCHLQAPLEVIQTYGQELVTTRCRCTA